MSEAAEKVQWNVRLDKDFADRLRAAGEKRTINLSALTRRLLEERLQAWEEEDRQQQGA